MLTDPVCGTEIEEIDVPECLRYNVEARPIISALWSARVSSRTGKGL